MNEIFLCRYRLLFFFFCFSFFSTSQNNTKGSSFIDIDYFKGYIPLHNSDILHLIEGRPGGTLIAWNQRTNGLKKWQRRYNYPDYGISMIFQDFGSDVLGATYGVYGHFNFYFFRRHLMLRIAQGLIYASNPYSKSNNPKNIAFGSRLLASPYLMLNYNKPKLIGPIGIQSGLLLFHASNGNFKAPNTSVNTISFIIGFNYDLDMQEITIKNHPDEYFLKEKIKLNLVFRSGLNQMSAVGSPQFPFYTFSAYLDKKINFFSAFQTGIEMFISMALKEEIYYRSVAFLEESSDQNADFKRVGSFVGHELFINNWSIISQLGYYIYYPYDFEGRFYNRLGLKYYFGDNWFGGFSVKSHSATAEAFEFGIGIRL